MKFVAFVFLIFSFSGFSQSGAVNLPPLSIFKNPAEQKIFEDIRAGNGVDYLSLYLISDGPAGNKNIPGIAKEKINEFISSGEIGKLKNGANAKALKKLYKSIHDQFLTKYTDNPSFSEVFETGNYNCATASALYVLLLDQLSISYTIRETPTHVYLIVSPGQNDVVFETTAPGATSIQINEKMKTQYLEYLYSNKMISKEEWTSEDRNELFQQYFYTDEAVNPRQLAGILYYNRGISEMMKENYSGAYSNFEKASYLYPHEKMRYFVSASIVLHLLNSKPGEDDDKSDYYIRYLQVGNKDVGGKMIVEYIEETAKKYLFKNPDPAKYKRIYQSVLSAMDDTALSKDIRQVHYYHTAHYFDIKNKYDSASIYLDSVYALNKNDLLVQELITNMAASYLQSMAQTPHVVDTVLLYFRKYPFLESNNRLREFYVYCMTMEVAEYYKKDKVKEASKYFDELKELIAKETSLVKKSENYITYAFLEVYYYHIRTKKYKEAKAFLQYVDKYLPGNEEITRRLKRVDEILANQ